LKSSPAGFEDRPAFSVNRGALRAVPALRLRGAALTKPQNARYYLHPASRPQAAPQAPAKAGTVLKARRADLQSPQGCSSSLAESGATVQQGEALTVNF